MARRNLLLALLGLAIVIGSAAAVVVWICWPAKDTSPEDILGSWKSTDMEKHDVQITFWRSGDFQMAKTFESDGRKVVVRGSGTWEISKEHLILSIDTTVPPGYAGRADWEIVRVTDDQLIYRGKEQYTLIRVSKEGADHDPPTQPSFNGSSDKLEQTVIVPTLESVLPPGKSAIWCTTMSLAWKQLEKEVLKEPVALEGDQELARNLSQSPETELLSKHFYVAAGFHDDGIMDRIRRELSAKFPKAPLPPAHLASKPGEALAFAYLETSIRYEFAYKDIDMPMRFKNSQGRLAAVKAFGIREEDKEVGSDTFRSQVKVLFRDGDDFALDLSRKTKPYQIVLARMGKKATLKETLASLDQRIAEAPGKMQVPRFGDGAILGVPNMDWNIEHHFKELQGKAFRNRALPAGSFLQDVTQIVKFKIDRRGAELQSADIAGTAWNGSHPEDFRFDRPYLIVLKKRDAQHPFFVMWVDNAELMQVAK